MDCNIILGEQALSIRATLHHSSKHQRKSRIFPLLKMLTIEDGLSMSQIQTPIDDDYLVYPLLPPQT